MRRFNRFNCSLFILCLVSTITHAQNGDSDHDLVRGFPNSSVVSHSSSSNTLHQLALGILQRNAGVAEPEVSRRVTGTLTKILYEIPREFDGGDVYRFFRDQLDSNAFTPLFSCTGRACGSSNDWANDIFGNRILYGPAQNQYYAVYQQSSERGQEAYVSVYIITRGNRRLYAYLEILEPVNPSANASNNHTSMLEELLEEGFVSIENLDFANDTIEDTGQLSPLLNLLGSNPEVEVYIVAHLNAEGSLSEVRDRSGTRAQSVVDYLIDQGINPSRLTAEGLGPLAPGCASQQCRNRLEVVVR